MKYFKNYIIFLLLYFSLLIGFYYNENLNFGAYSDWVSVYVPPINDFQNNFKDTILNYDNYGQRHSPIYLIFLSILKKIGFSFDAIRLIHLHLCLTLILIFYKCLKLKFKEINSSTLQILSFIIFLSPTFRSLSIWPDSRLPGLIFFTYSVFFFLKFLNQSKNIDAWYSALFLIFSSYISPNFSIFGFYYYFIYFKRLNFINFFKLFIFSSLVSIPILYYLFVMDVNFLLAGNTPGSDGDSVNLNFNYSNKILLISSIILFHSIPVMIPILELKKICYIIKKYYLYVILTTLLLFNFFNYQIGFTGGGVFFQISLYLFDNNYLFLFVCFISILFISFLNYLSFQNLILIILLIISNIQNTIYHKYYEPLILIMLFTIFKNLDFEKYFKYKYSILILYLFSAFYIFLRIVKNNFII